MSSYLFIRILKHGTDARWDKTKHKPLRFFIYWMLQAVWVIIVSLPVIAINSIHPAAFKAGLGVPEVLRTDIVGFVLFLFGLFIESLADYQKSVWSDQKRKKLHDELFITRGLWGRRFVVADLTKIVSKQLTGL